MAPPNQRTFALVPTTLVATTSSKPPMTSKAAKKAYSKSNQTPRVSRAEQRRRDAEEVDRLKKELEKDKRTRAAKAARERKAEKEEQEKKERKQRGEAEKSRWVRASQPSIKGFVRSGKRKRDDGGESEGTASDDEGSRDGKRLAIVAEQDREMVVEETVDEKITGECSRLLDLSRECTNRENGKEVDEEPDSEDEFGDFPALSQPALLEAILSSSVKSSPPAMRYQQLGALPNRHTDSAGKAPSQELPTYRKRHGDDILYGTSQDEADLLRAQIRSEEAEAVARSDPLELPQHRMNSRTARSNRMDGASIICAVPSQTIPSARRRSLEQQQSKIVPQKEVQNIPTFKIPAIPQPRKPVAIKSQQIIPPREYAPPSTQAFLEDNIDDFMLTPSQEARELLDDVDDDVAIPIKTLPPISRPPHLARSVVDDLIDDFICTQDLILSAQDLEELSPAKPAIRAQRKPSVASRQSMPSPTFKKPPIPKGRVSKVFNTNQIAMPNVAAIASNPSVEASAFLDDFPCTQDLLLSPSDLEELNTPSKPLPPAVPKTKNNLDIEMRNLLARPSHSSRPIQKVITPVEHNLPHPARHRPAAITLVTQPSKKVKVTVVSNPPLVTKQPNPLPRKALSETNSNTNIPPPGHPTPQSPAHKPPTNPNHNPKINKSTSRPSSTTTSTTTTSKPRFFEEKENDLYQAALHESKIMAEKGATKAKVGSHSSSGGNGARRNDIGTGKVEKRKLKRVESLVASDYGDDEFEGICEEDLLSVLS